jgi:hypothetical protein
MNATVGPKLISWKKQGVVQICVNLLDEKRGRVGYHKYPPADQPEFIYPSQRKRENKKNAR